MDIVSEVELLVNESGGAVWWTAQQVYDGINQSLEEIFGHLKWNVVVSTLTVTSGDDIVAYDNTTIMIPQFIMSSGTKLFPTEHDELENWSRTWRNEPHGKPKWIVQWDESHFRLFPNPDQTYEFQVWGAPWPQEVSSTNTDVTMDEMGKKAVIFRAVAHLMELTQPQLADTYYAESQEYEKRFSEQLRTNLGANVWHLRPAVGWTHAQFGDIKIGRKY